MVSLTIHNASHTVKCRPLGPNDKVADTTAFTDCRVLNLLWAPNASGNPRCIKCHAQNPKTPIRPRASFFLVGEARCAFSLRGAAQPAPDHWARKDIARAACQAPRSSRCLSCTCPLRSSGVLSCEHEVTDGMPRCHFQWDFKVIQASSGHMTREGRESP